jgi:23S rRNA pseudouridine2605 synthase
VIGSFSTNHMFRKFSQVFGKQVLNKTPKTVSKIEDGLRLSRFLARSGVCSRRQADELITEGRVSINGKKIEKVGTKVIPTDKIVVNGHVIDHAAAESTQLFIYRKPPGVLCSRVSQKGERTLAEELRSQGYDHLMKVGRLDLNSEGLLLLTNDGEFARTLEHPSTEIERKYLVKINGTVTQSHLQKFSRGSFIDGVHYGQIETQITRQTKAATWITVTLREGKNREIRKVFRHMGMHVAKLIRISYGPYKLGKIQRNQLQSIDIHSSWLKYCTNHNFSK